MTMPRPMEIILVVVVVALACVWNSRPVSVSAAWSQEMRHPLRPQGCEITITQRGYDKWRPETCARGSYKVVAK